MPGELGNTRVPPPAPGGPHFCLPMLVSFPGPLGCKPLSGGWTGAAASPGSWDPGETAGQARQQARESPGGSSTAGAGLGRGDNQGSFGGILKHTDGLVPEPSPNGPPGGSAWGNTCWPWVRTQCRESRRPMTWGGIQSLNGAGRVREQQARAGRFLLPIRRDQAGPSAPCSAALPALSGPGWCADR